jgi:hypothetical protein
MAKKNKEKDRDKDADKKLPTGPRARNDAYVMMLVITFLAIVTGTVLMYLDNDEYGGKPPPNAPSVEVKAPTPAEKGAGS